MKYYWHIHHDNLVEGSEDIAERIAYINHTKPAEEIETRLRLLKEVQGQLPQEWQDAYKAWLVYKPWWDVSYKVWQDAKETYKQEIEVLHAIECPGCPWDGHTIFPEKEKP